VASKAVGQDGRLIFSANSITPFSSFSPGEKVIIPLSRLMELGAKPPFDPSTI
jgi:hypothetical protein